MVVVFNFSSFIPGLMAQTQTQHQRQQQQQQRQQLHPFYLKLNHLEDLTTDNIRNIVTTFLNRIPQYEEEDNSDGPRIIVKLRNRNLLENAREIFSRRSSSSFDDNDDSLPYARNFGQNGIVINRTALVAFELQAGRSIQVSLLMKLIQSNISDGITVDPRRILKTPEISSKIPHQHQRQRRQLQEEEEIEIEQEENNEIIPYGIRMVQADYNWIQNPTSNYQVRRVCIVDTGMLDGHPDLPSSFHNNVTGTTTYAGDWHFDGNGHGTHITGTIGALGNNKIGVIGIRADPYYTNYHVAKAMDDAGVGYGSTVMKSIEACASVGANIITLSIEGPTDNPLEREYYKELYNSNILVVAAAGNFGNTGDHYPAAYPHVMSVGAVNASGYRPTFSQCNAQVEIVAPGIDIYSTCNNAEYCFKSGTSMAAPHVAGVASAIWSHFPQCTNYQIRNILLRSAKHVGGIEGCSRGYGNGLVQTQAAYEMLRNYGCDAGGPLVDDPAIQAAVGGCEQNPDISSLEYLYWDHPNRDQCEEDYSSSTVDNDSDYYDTFNPFDSYEEFINETTVTESEGGFDEGTTGPTPGPPANVGCPKYQPAGRSHCAGWIRSGAMENSCRYEGIQCLCIGENSDAYVYGWQCEDLGETNSEDPGGVSSLSLTTASSSSLSQMYYRQVVHWMMMSPLLYYYALLYY